MELVYILALILAAAIAVSFAYEKWIVPEHIKETDEYKKNKYKDVNCC